MEVEVAVCTLGWGPGAGQRQGTFRAEHVLAAFSSGHRRWVRAGHGEYCPIAPSLPVMSITIHTAPTLLGVQQRG